VSTRIDVGGAALHVERRGRGTPVLVLHGFTGSTRTMEGLIEGLARWHSVVGVDLLGHGRSDAPADPARYRMERCVADLARVLGFVGANPAHVVGYSMGGRVALGLAALRPECVRSVVAVGASPGIADPAARAERQRADEERARALRARGLEAFVDDWMALPLFQSQRRRLGDEFWASARKLRLENDPLGLASCLRGLGAGAQAPLHEALARTRVPTLLAVGAEDAKFRAIALDLSARIRRAAVAVIPDAGHAAHLENAPALLRQTLEFLSARDAQGPPYFTSSTIRERSATP
jgi:2-succinyl-6-hydroxy-2,4-cyclohexadiene-1-carboxylate synthase